MAVSPELMGAFEAHALQGFALQTDHARLATARQTDAAAALMTSLSGFIAGELFRANDPEAFAGLNTGSRIPITLDQPGVKHAP